MKKIFIDPGHGGAESGAVGNGMLEKELNLYVSRKVKQHLSYNNIETKMSREDDSYVNLSDRTKMANSWGADYFISIHHNSGGGDGYEVIHSIFEGEGKRLALAIAEEFDKTGQNKRRVFSRKNPSDNTDYYAVIRNSIMPAIITEYAFIDTQDYISVDNEFKLNTEAKAIAKGIVSYLGLTFKDMDNDKTIISDYENHWAKDYIIRVMDEGIFLKADKFRPDHPLTRAEAAAICTRLLEKISKL